MFLRSNWPREEVEWALPPSYWLYAIVTTHIWAILFPFRVRLVGLTLFLLTLFKSVSLFLTFFLQLLWFLFPFLIVTTLLIFQVFDKVLLNEAKTLTLSFQNFVEIPFSLLQFTYSILLFSFGLLLLSLTLQIYLAPQYLFLHILVFQTLRIPNQFPNYLIQMW